MVSLSPTLSTPHFSKDWPSPLYSFFPHLFLSIFFFTIPLFHPISTTFHALFSPDKPLSYTPIFPCFVVISIKKYSHIAHRKKQLIQYRHLERNFVIQRVWKNPKNLLERSSFLVKIPDLVPSSRAKSRDPLMSGTNKGKQRKYTISHHHALFRAYRVRQHISNALAYIENPARDLYRRVCQHAIKYRHLERSREIP